MYRPLVIYAALLLFCATHVKSQVLFLGGCPRVTVQQDFDVDRYMGVWFEYKKFFAIFESGGTCISATYNNEGNDVIGVINRQYNPLYRRYTSITGNAVPLSKTGEAKLRVNFPVVGPGLFQDKNRSNYMVLGTDYSNYSVVWACQDLFLFNLQFAWVLTRNQKPTDDVIKDFEAVFTRNHLVSKALLKTDQTQCSTR